MMRALGYFHLFCHGRHPFCQTVQLQEDVEPHLQADVQFLRFVDVNTKSQRRLSVFNGQA